MGEGWWGKEGLTSSRSPWNMASGVRISVFMGPSPARGMVSKISGKVIPAACIIPGKRLCSVNPGMVLISLKTILPWGVRNRSTRAKPGAAQGPV